MEYFLDGDSSIMGVLRGHPHITSPPWGEGGLQNDDRGLGGYEIMTSSIKEVFCSSIQKRSLKVNCSMP